MKISSFIIFTIFAVHSILSTGNMMKARENLIKNQKNGLMRSFLTEVNDEFDEPSAVADLREVVFDIKNGQMDENPELSDFIIE